LRNPFDTNVRLGTERPFSLNADKKASWHWIEGKDWHVIDQQSGELLKTWELPDDCVCSPKLIRTLLEGRTFVLTAHAALANATDFVAWDVESNQAVWQQSIECDLNRLPQSYLSRQSDFPIVVDLDGDGADEWIAPSHVGGTRWSNPMTPPYGMVMAHRGDNGKSIWQEPFHLPNLDGMVERAVAVSDMDGDGWKELLLGSRFQGGGVRDGVACFVDLISGRTGKRLWHSKVRTESSEPTLGSNELVDLYVLEDQRLIAVVTHIGLKTYNMESPRPYSTTFLNLHSGGEETFGLGLRASSFSHDTWLEQRLPPEPLQRAKRPRPSKLVGWAYPVMKTDSMGNLTLWSTEDYGPYLCADLDRDGFPEVLGAQNNVGYREYSLLNGLTGAKGWKRKFESQLTTFWFELGQDVDKDDIDDLVVLMSDLPLQAGGNNKEQVASVEIVSGSTGKTIWKHSATGRGMVTCLNYFKRDSAKLPLFLYQHDQSQKVTCLDLDSRKVAWTSDDFKGVVEGQSYEPWIFEGKIVWFSVAQTEEGCNASFVNAENGELILQIPIGQQPADATQQIQKAVAPTWIRLDNRDLFAIQTVTRRTVDAANSTYDYCTDLWLVDKSVTLVDHWSETNTATESAALASWFQNSNYYAPSPTVVKTLDNEEHLAISTSLNGSIVFRLLGWDNDEKPSLTVDRTIDLPIDPSSTAAFVWTLDCDGDGISDFVSLSDAGLDCLSGTGDVLWHQPPFPRGSLFCQPSEISGRKYLWLQTHPPELNSLIRLDARTGEECKGVETNTLNNALNADNLNHSSLITCVYAPRNTIITATRRNGAKITTSNLRSDPRYTRLLPWVVNAKFFLASNPVTVGHFSWTRILRLALGVFLVPVLVAWTCLRKQFSIRHLLLVATTVAVALALVLADKNAFPSSENGIGYIDALATACVIAILALFFALPLVELTRTRWRRILSIGVYGAFLLIIPAFTLLTNPVGAIRTTYTFHEYWHLFWFSLLPTGAVLLLLHSLRILGSGVFRIANGSRRSYSSLWPKKVPTLQSSGDSHGG